MSTLELYEIFNQSTGVSIDTRSLVEGNLFFALKGPNFDGHKFVATAFNSGASFCIVQDESYADNDRVILVKNSEEALQNLAKIHRCHLTIPVIGLTGSNGKTTTKELMASVLKTKYNVFATKGNYNNHLGVPLSVLSIKKEHEIAIIEMGANRQGEIKFLSEIAMPDIGLITNIGKAHLEGFGGLEGVRKGKTELYNYIESTCGLLFYNLSEDKLVKSLPLKTETISYSNAMVEYVSSYPFVTFKYKNTEIHSNLSGTYNLTNMVAALIIGEHFDISIEDLKKGIETYIPTNNRSQIKRTKHNVLLLDAYNANPSSMLESINNFQTYPQDSKILILGHMLELGETSMIEHENLIQYISKFSWNHVFLVGSEFEGLDCPSEYEVFTTTDELNKRLQQLSLRDNAILLKGSRGVAVEKSAVYL